MHATQCHNKKLEAAAVRPPAIQVSSLTKSIATATHRVDILRGIDLEIQLGEFVAIMGPSGSGKSTLLGLLAGLDTPTSGRIILDGEDITGLNEDRMALLRGRKVGFVFQSYHLLPTLTAEENVLLPYELTGGNGGGGAGDARLRAVRPGIAAHHAARRTHCKRRASGIKHAILLENSGQDCMARIALVGVQISIRHSGGCGRSRIAHRCSRIQPRFSRDAV